MGVGLARAWSLGEGVRLAPFAAPRIVWVRRLLDVESGGGGVDFSDADVEGLPEFGASLRAGRFWSRVGSFLAVPFGDPVDFDPVLLATVGVAF